MKFNLLVLSSSLLAARLAAAHPQAPLLYPPERVAMPAPLLHAAGSCGRSIAGDFTADRTADVVSLCAGDAYLTHAPALYGGAQWIAAHVADFDVWRHAGADRDSLLIASTAHPLRLATWAASSSAPAGAVEVTPFAGPTNSHASQVAAFDADGDGDLEIAIASPDGAVVSIWGCDGDGWEESPRTFTPAATLRRLAAIEWDTSLEGRELALLSDAGLQVISASDCALGVTHFDDLRPTASSAFAVWRDDPAARQRAAWIVHHTSGGGALVVSDGRGSEPAVALGAALSVQGMTAAPLAPGLRSALFVSHSYNHTLGLLLPSPSAQPPLTATYSLAPGAHAFLALVTNDPSQGFTANRAQPLVEDFDNDGDLDLWMPLVTTQESVTYPAELINACLLRPRLTDAKRTADTLGSQVSFELDFELPLELNPAGLDALEIAVQAVNTAGVPVQTVQHTTVALNGLFATVTVAVPATVEPDESFNRRFVAVVRFVGPSRVTPYGAFSITGNVFDWIDDLADRGCVTSETFFYFETARAEAKHTALATVPAAENIGGVIPKPRPPPGGGTPIDGGGTGGG